MGCGDGSEETDWPSLPSSPAHALLDNSLSLSSGRRAANDADDYHCDANHRLDAPIGPG